MTPGSCSVMNCPLDESVALRLIERPRNDAGLIAEQIIGDEVQGGRGFFVGDRRTDPRKSDAVDRSSGRGGRGRAARAASRMAHPCCPCAPSVTAVMLEASTLPRERQYRVLGTKGALGEGAHLRRRDARERGNRGRQRRIVRRSARKDLSKEQVVERRIGLVTLLHAQHGSVCPRGLHRGSRRRPEQNMPPSSRQRRGAPTRPGRLPPIPTMSG